MIAKGVIKPAPAPTSVDGHHHGRFGGRLLEVVLTLLLVIASAAALVGSFLGTYKVLALLGLKRRSSGKLVSAVYMGVLAGLAAVWRAFLRYYRYDPNTLRPIRPEDTDDRKDH